MFSCCFRKTAALPALPATQPPSPIPPDLPSPATAAEPQTQPFTDKTDYYPVSYKDTLPWVPPITQGKVVKVYDGDTITLASRFYEGSPIWRFSVRLRGIDTPEMKGGNVFERIKAKEAQAALERLIFMKMVKLKNVATEKYGRILADVYLDDLHVNRYMLDGGYAVSYNGGKKKEWNFAEEETAAD